MNSIRVSRILFALICFLSADLALLSDSAFGQPPGGRGGYDRGRDDRGRDDRGRDDRGRDRDDWMTRSDPSHMLARADKNRDGKVEPSEIDDRFRGYTDRLLKHYGFDPNKTVDLKSLSKKYEEVKNKQSKSEEKSASEVSETFGIPGFDDVADTLPPMVPDFYLQADSPLLMTGPIESRYDRSILDQVDRTLRQSDRNRDGVLDAEEIRRGRWDRPPAADSDLNKDGRLTKVELAERYVKRNGGRGRIETSKKSTRSSRSSQSSSRSSSRDRKESERREPSRSGRENSSVKMSPSQPRSSSPRRSSGSDRESKILDYSKSILSKHDKNSSGKLEKEEFASIRSLPKGVDSNKDGILTLDELVVGFGGKPGSSGSSGSSRTRVRTNENNVYLVPRNEERAEEADRDFREIDVNRDGLIQMHEYSKGKSWSNDMADEFMDFDRDNNGVLTIKEWSSGPEPRSSRSSSSGSSSSRFSSSSKPSYSGSNSKFPQRQSGSSGRFSSGKQPSSYGNRSTKRERSSRF